MARVGRQIHRAALEHPGFASEIQPIRLANLKQTIFKKLPSQIGEVQEQRQTIPSYSDRPYQEVKNHYDMQTMRTAKEIRVECYGRNFVRNPAG